MNTTTLTAGIPSVRESVTSLFDAAVPFCDMPDGMAERIRAGNRL